jgi:signal transduction histidine kinase
MNFSWVRRLNPLRTLAGQLILVTIAAVALSQIIAGVLFTHERGRSIRALSETNAIERVVAAADRIRDASFNEHAQLARSASDIAVQFELAGAPETPAGARASQRIATEISERLDSAETHATLRTVDIVWPRRFILHRGPDGMRWDRRGDRSNGPPEDDERLDRYRPPPDRLLTASPDPAPTRRVDELTVFVNLGGAHWLRARAYLPTPRPAPASLYFGALLSVVAVGIAAALVARRIGAPLAQLTKAAERLGFGDTKVKAPESGPEDVRRASAAFNAMAERLGRQMERQRHMLWALSHDLRTPITALRLRAELLDDDAARQKILNSLADMESLTEQALALARAGASEEARQNVDLAEIVRTLCGELEDLGINVRAVAPQAVFAECRPDEIVRALRNLAENAQKYAGGGEMHVRREDKAVVIEMLDDGPGIAEAELARVTDPFFRADEARSQGSDGVGLGLAIAQAIADSHGGKLLLSNRRPRGLSAKLILPL